MAAHDVRITCTHDCPDACSAIVSVDPNGRAVGIRADASHPITGRHLCVKVDRYLERVYSPDRVMTPLRRIGPKGEGRFEPITWDGALAEIASRWQQIIDTHGPEAILPYSYLGSMGILDAFGTCDALFNRLGATQLDRSICGPQGFAVTFGAGVQWSDPENLPDATTIIVWGMDPVSTSIHTWELIRKARKHNNAKLVVIDPYRSRTAAYADIHLRPHAGTDGALAMAVGHVIMRDGMADDGFIAEHTTDIDAYRAAVGDWNPERAAEETGLSAAEIIRFAHLYATARPAAIRYGVGMQRSAGSGSALRAIQCLPALTGQQRWAAGGISGAVSIGAFNLGAISRPDFTPADTRSVNMIQLGRVLTDSELNPPIKALHVWNSNPAVIAADQQKVLEGLRRDDLFTVVHDQFLTDTARHADIVLPATTMLEHADLVGSWGFSYISWNEAAIKPVGQSKSNAEVARLLASRLGFDDELFKLDDHQLMELALSHSAAADEGITAESLSRDGFARVGTPSGEAVGADFTFAFSADGLAAAGIHPVAEYRPPANIPARGGAFPLRLLTLKRHYSINSSYTALPVFLGAEPETHCEIHPDDAKPRGIKTGDRVRVVSDLGEMEAVASVTEKVIPGTVAVPFGRGQGQQGAAGANSLTSDLLGDIAGGPTFCDNLVEVEALA